MCGIGAIFGNKIEEKDFSIKRSLEVIEHRGYSRYEIKSVDNAVLGTNRLQIVDRQNAMQPVENEDSTIFAILNGEIFNHKEIKKSLTKKGHNFKTDSDTETLVHLWEEYGESMFNKLDSE